MSGLDCEVCGFTAKKSKALAHHMIMEHPLLVEDSLPEEYDKKQYMVRAKEKAKQANDRKERLEKEVKERNMRRAAAKERLKVRSEKERQRSKVRNEKERQRSHNKKAAAAARDKEVWEQLAFVDTLWVDGVG